MEADVFFSEGISKSGYCSWHLQKCFNYDRRKGNCGRSDKVIIKSTKSKVPKDFRAFLRNGVNKNRLIDLLCDTISSSSDRAISILQTSAIYFSKEGSCVRVNASLVTTVGEFSSNQEEADTKVTLHSGPAISTTEVSIIVRSSSGGIDIIIIAISLIDTSKRVLVDYGNGKNRKGVWLNSIDFDDNIRAALIGFRAFTGNDYVSSFFKRGKQSCFKVMNSVSNLSMLSDCLEKIGS